MEMGGSLPLSYIQLLETGFFESVAQTGLEFVICLPHPLWLISSVPGAGWELAF